MRATRFPIIAVCLLVSASALSAQGGGKKHHKSDSASVATTTTATPSEGMPPAPSLTLKGGESFSKPFAVVSDPTFRSDVTISSGEVPAKEVFAVQSVPAYLYGNHGSQFGTHWSLDKSAYIDIGWSVYGQWTIYGSINIKDKSAQYIEVVFAVKKKDGEVWIFHGLDKVTPGWNAPNVTSPPPKVFKITPFNDLLANGYEIRGAYRLLTKAVGKSEGKGLAATSKCSTPDKFAAGWTDIWTWVDPHKVCVQYNLP